MLKQKYGLGVLLAVLVLLAAVLMIFSKNGKPNMILSPISSINEKPLDKYSFENLRKRQYAASGIRYEKVKAIDQKFTSWIFSFESDGRKVSGVANLPNEVATTSAISNPVIIMIHGFVSPEEYYPGFGTERVAAELARAGYVTFAPDFFGFGESDKQVSDVFEDRFQSYTTVLNLTATIQKNCAVANCIKAVWGHSNGGQIALSVSEISGTTVPLILWNPVSKFFPYSILYYTDSFDDGGKALRKSLANFEKDYDVEKYSISGYFNLIQAPILLQQGEKDMWVPKKWSDELNQKLGDLKKKVVYKVYPGADHNLVPGWNRAVSDLLQFLREQK